MRLAGALDLSGTLGGRTELEQDSHTGWYADLALRFARRGTRTALVERRHLGPLTIQRPFYPESDGACHAYILHPPAGIVGGDDVNVTVAVDAEAHALVTTPAATRWYFSRGREARARQSGTVASGATLEWLPQETLLFDGAHARLLTRIDLWGDARFCGWEILGFGRPACGESFRSGRIDFRFEISRDGTSRVLERLHGVGGVAGLHGYASCAMLVATPANAQSLEHVRAALRESSGVLCAATLIKDVLIVRGLAPECEPLKIAFAEVWTVLRPLVLGRSAVPPRIWRT